MQREAVSIAHHIGIPAQKFMVADAVGQGRVDRRRAFAEEDWVTTGASRCSWAFGDRRWRVS